MFHVSCFILLYIHPFPPPKRRTPEKKKTLVGWLKPFENYELLVKVDQHWIVFPFCLEVNMKHVLKPPPKSQRVETCSPQETQWPSWHVKCLLHRTLLVPGSSWVRLTTSWGTLVGWLVAWLLGWLFHSLRIRASITSTTTQSPPEGGENLEILLMAEIRWENQLRWVGYPVICRVSLYIQKVVVWDFWTINSRIVKAVWILETATKKHLKFLIGIVTSVWIPTKSYPTTYRNIVHPSLWIPTLKNPHTNRSQGPGPSGCARFSSGYPNIFHRLLFLCLPVCCGSMVGIPTMFDPVVLQWWLI